MNQTLIEQIKKQDTNAFQQFYHIYVERFYRYLKSRSYLTDTQIHDIVSDTFYQLRIHLPDLSDNSKFESYIWTTLRSQFYQQIKARKPDARVDEIEDTLSDNSMDRMDNNIEMWAIQWTLEKLDETTRDIIHLRYIEELEYDEIAGITWLTNDWVRQRLSRWFKKLKTLLLVNRTNES